MICPICNFRIREPLTPLRGVISPWIRKLARLKKRLSKLHACPNCHGAFFEYRYDEFEMRRIYENYRGDVYTSTRNIWEPWYSWQFNSNHETSEYLQERRRGLQAFLIANGQAEIGSVIDVGGGSGSLIPEFQTNTEKYVLDYSSQSSAPEVSKISSLENIGKVDLIIWSHVMEHVAQPFEELSKLLEHATYVYAEVPFGVPSPSPSRKSLLLQIVGLAISLNSNVYSRFSRPSAGRVSSKLFIRQSEHLSFFEESTFGIIARTHGVRVSSEIATSPSPDGSEARVIRAIFSQD